MTLHGKFTINDADYSPLAFDGIGVFMAFSGNGAYRNKGACGIIPKEGANKQVISSQADSLIKISRIWADFFPANTSNQPI